MSSASGAPGGWAGDAGSTRVGVCGGAGGRYATWVASSSAGVSAFALSAPDGGAAGGGGGYDWSDGAYCVGMSSASGAAGDVGSAGVGVIGGDGGL